MHCGCEYTSFPMFTGLDSYSRHKHSVGCALIVWRFTQDQRQTIAALLHDIATPTFAHVIDFLNGDHMKQESTESGTTAIIESSPEIMTKLKTWGISLGEVSDYHQYPIADNDSPHLSADRLEYTLSNMLNYHIAPIESVRLWFESLIVGKNEEGEEELMFPNLEIAEPFSMAALQTSQIYVADEDRFSMEVLARLLRLALERNVIGPEDLYGTEPQVIRRLEADAVCGPLWRRYRGYTNIESRPSRPAEGQWLQIPAKLRCIDPLAVGMGRVSQWAPQFRQSLEEFRETSFDSWLGPVRYQLI